MKNSLSQETIFSLLKALSHKRALVAPVEGETGVDYARCAPAEALLDGRLPTASPKGFFFPQTEKVYTLQDGQAQPAQPEEALLLAFAKPCDLAGLALLRAVLLGGPHKDPLFAARDENSLVIGLGCTGKKPGCFCDETGLSMDYSPHCDIFLQPEETGFSIRHLSEKGREALAGFPDTAPLANIELPAPPKRTPALSFAAAENENALFNCIDWEGETLGCLGCAMCTYVCPTCHCFAFRDATEEGGTARYRVWDFCLSPKFTLHASGHNPRAQKYERFRQRVLHKYYYLPQNTGLLGCTGCGRCLRGCPAGMDIHAVARQICEVL